jgi:hypothetical protein
MSGRTLRPRPTKAGPASDSAPQKASKRKQPRACDQTTYAKPPKSAVIEKALCMRCHDRFIEADNHGEACLIDHSYDSFEGSRNGTSWYSGVLQCCGADYEFHRFYAHRRLEVKQCFVGRHTSEPDQVKYNGRTIRPIGRARCVEVTGSEGEGTRLTSAAQAAFDSQKQRKKEEKVTESDLYKQRWIAYWKTRIDEAPKEFQRRERRKERAHRLGMDCDSDELDSDLDEWRCQEIDCARSESLESETGPNWGPRCRY